MTQANLLAKIDAAKKVINEAENELRRVEDSGVVSSAEEDVREVSEVVQAALLRVKAAEATLGDLERLLDLEKNEAAQLKAANRAIVEAEKDLDRVLAEIQVSKTAQETLVTEVVADAFANLRAAKRELADLEKSIATDKD